ncbi:MAG: CHASE domain-containing protein [Aquabacterium sp.]
MSSHLTARDDARLHERAYQATMCLVVLIFCLSLTLLGVNWINRDAHQEAELNFDRYVERLEVDMGKRFGRLLNSFKGLRGYYAASRTPVMRDDFRIWVASRRLQEDMAGVRGLGFIQRVPRGDLQAFVEAERADYAPGFRVSTSGQASDLYVIKFIEPLVHNEKAWGYDVGSEPVRREAAERAVATGEPALTARIVLVQDGKKRPGYLYYMPVFKWATKIDTPEDRRRNLVGLIYAPIVLEEFMAGIADVADRQIDVELYDGTQAQADRKVFDLGLSHDADRSPMGDVMSPHAVHLPARHEAVRSLEVGGHGLVMLARSTLAFDARYQRNEAWWFGATGTLLSLLVTVTVWLLLAGRSRAEAIAQGMTLDLSEAKLRAEAALRENTVLLDTLQRFNLMSVADRQGHIVEVNDAFCQVSGYAREELIGQRHSIMNSRVHPDAFWAEMWQTIVKGQPWVGEVCNKARDGRLFWVKTIVVPMIGQGGLIEKFLSIRTDITENKRNEQALHAMTERYQLAVDGGSDGLWDWLNVNDHKMWWSPQLYRMLGYEPDEFPAGLEAFERLMSREGRRELQRAIEAALTNSRPLDATMSLRTKSGGYRWFRCRGKVFYDEQGYPMRMAGSMHDVHDRHVAEEVVQKHSEQLSAIFSLSPDGFVSFGSNGQVSYASAAYGSLTGLSVESVLCLDEGEFLAQLLALCVNPPSLRALDELVQKVDHKDPLSWLSRHRLVLELKEPAGRMLALSLFQTQGDTVSRLLLVRDVTHEAEVDRMKSNFLSMAAHELRTPMASIYGFVELLLDREMKVDRQKDLLGRVHRQCEVMISIINELLDLARIEQRRGADFECRPWHLQDMVLEAVGDYQPPAHRDGPQVVPADAALAVVVDRQKLCQALLNVLSNAYKYSPQGGRVRVSFPTRQDAHGVDWCGVCIEDEGIGMTAEQLAHIGERFFRADKSGSIPGTGLGVSIVKEIMELMGGAIEVRSQPGQGTTVILWMRRSQVTQPEALLSEA